MTLDDVVLSTDTLTTVIIVAIFLFAWFKGFQAGYMR